MVFSSTLFLFYFLPAIVVASFLSKKHKNLLLLMGSLVFYAWGETRYIIVLFYCILVSYACALLIERKHRSRNFYISVGIFLNLLALVIFKYIYFFSSNLQALLNSMTGGQFTFAEQVADIHLPLGISFFTFQAISYLIDVYRAQTVAATNPLNVALYISMFPQLVAGPIVRYHTIAEELRERSVDRGMLAEGIRVFIFGLSQKALIANIVALPVDNIYALPLSEITTPLAWTAALGYTLQIFFDFAGYSNMAIGLGLMFGFHFPINFNAPYISQSVTEFWRRWHISLSSWFKDYLYIPLGGNRRSTVRTYVNLWTVFVLCGVWHGASWNFLFWGVYHGFFLVVERMGLAKLIRKLPRMVRHAYLLLAVVIGWVFFRAETMTYALGFLKAMFLGGQGSSLDRPLAMYVLNDFYLAFAAGVLFSMPLKDFFRERLAGKTCGPLAPLADTVCLGCQLGLFVLCILFISSGAHNPFIYFRF